MTPRRWALLALALVGAGAALVWQDAGVAPVPKGDAAAPLACGARNDRYAEPAGWKRIEHRSAVVPGLRFAFSVPPDMGDVVRSTDGEGGRFTSPRFELRYEHGPYAPLLEPQTEAGDRRISRDEETVCGRQAIVSRVQLKNGSIVTGVRFPGAPDAGPSDLSIFATCADAATCADVVGVGRSVEID